MGPAGERGRGVAALALSRGTTGRNRSSSAATCHRFARPRRPVVVAASAPRCTATAARHHRFAATDTCPCPPSPTTRRGCSPVRWARQSPHGSGGLGRRQTGDDRRRPPSSVRAGGGKEGQARPVSRDASARQWRDRPTERLAPRGVGRGRAPPARRSCGT